MERLAAKAGVDEEWVRDRLNDPRHAQLGPRRVIRRSTNGIVWKWKEEDCVACSIVVVDGPGPAMSGELYEVAPSDSREARMVAVAMPDRLWTDGEWTKIAKGVPPVSSDNKWWSIVRDDALTVCRREDGEIFHWLRFAQVPGGRRIAEAWTLDKGEPTTGPELMERMVFEVLLA